jgi:cell division protein FtsB
MVAVLVVGLFFLGAYPVRTWWRQHQELSSAHHELATLQAANQQLTDETAALQNPERIKELARERYNLVMPGTESYAILPLPSPPLPVPAGWPFNGLTGKLRPTGR